MQLLLTHLLAFIGATIISLNAHAFNTNDKLKNDPANPIRLFAIFHDDIPEHKRGNIYGEYILPFTREFESITNRKIDVIFDENKAPYSNFNYKGNERKAITEWTELAWKYRKKRHDDKEFLFSRHDRVLLITNEMINGSQLFGGIAGIANAQPGWAAISSMEIKQAIGHELGHTFNADHKHGDVFYNGWWCETFMFPPLALRSSCLKFSETNKKRIKEYVDSLY